MALYSPDNSPAENLELLRQNPYPGRFLVMGHAGDVKIQGYAVGGRSDDSKNRIFVKEDDIVSTEVFDKSRPPKRPDLTIYDAIRRVRGHLNVVSNGDQTATAIQFERSGLDFEAAMNSRKFEDDKPNNTLRISGYIDQNLTPQDGGFGISVIRRSETNKRKAIRSFYGSDLAPFESGVGFAVHTYRGEADGLLLPFDEPPFRLPLEDTPQAMAESLWDNLDHDTMIAVAVKAIAASGEVDFAIINGHEL